jgi:hypothetical protein
MYHHHYFLPETSNDTPMEVRLEHARDLEEAAALPREGSGYTDLVSFFVFVFHCS